MKRLLYLSAALLLFFAIPSCDKPDEDTEQGQEQVTVDLKKISQTVSTKVDKWIFTEKPGFTFQIENKNAAAVQATAKVAITTDKGAPVETITKEIEVPAGKSEFVLSSSKDYGPGFYEASCTVAYLVDGELSPYRGARSGVFGVNPTQIVSAPDKQADFENFWEAALNQLKAIEMNASLTELPERSTAARKAYLVEMNSVPNGLTGTPEVIRGYYLEPQDGQRHPVIMHYFGYDDLNPTSTVSCPSGGLDASFAEFYLSTRGQMINNRVADKRSPSDGKGDFVNSYGDWFAYNFGQRDAYYYRGAFMDCVQAVRFMASRPTSDFANIFAEGSSQGGAFSYATAALSVEYPLRAIAPCVAFLGDFPDYFSIVSWPGDVAKKNKGTMTDAEFWAFLSYFDTKNLATLINCPVIACIGLVDKTCPPHTNIAPFNNLKVTDKEMYYYPDMGHSIPGDWQSRYMKFFNDHLQIPT